MTDFKRPSTPADEEATLEEGRTLFFGRQYRAAFSHYHSALLSRAIRWFRDEGVLFQRPPADHTPTELIFGLAFAAKAEVTERGEDASTKLETAASLFAAIAELRMALEQPAPHTTEGMHELLAELTIRSAMVGQADMLMTVIEQGLLDKVAQFDVDRARRRAGAEVVNARKANARQTALNEAVRIAGRNQTLSNEELARKVIEATQLSTTIRTATEWVRQWRKEGFLPPIRAT